MSDYIVSARKYRPTNFNSVVGQSALTTTLKNAIATGKLAHAYLFCGPRGVGKTTSARIFAKTINCLTPNESGEACDHCESCVAFNEGRSYNIHELDAASNNSVDDIRELIDQVQIPPQVGRYKVFIIDEVHMLSQAAFNAFLKTLEEPPAHAIFILATTEKHKILPTILSRCQIYDFNRMEVGDTVRHLQHVADQEGIQYEEAALNVIARKADGGMRDALSIFDQVASFTGGNITYQATIDNLNVLDYDYYFAVTDHLLKGEIPESMMKLNEILSKGFEGGHFMSGLAAHFRDLLVSRDAQTLPLLEVAETVRQQYAEQAQRCSPRFLYRALKLCNDCDMAYRAAPNKRLLVELTLIQVAQILQEDEAVGSGRRPKKCLLPIFQLAPTTAVSAAQHRQVQPSAAPQVSSAMPSGTVPASPASSPLPSAGGQSSPAALQPSASTPAANAQPSAGAYASAQSQFNRSRLQTVSLTRRSQATQAQNADASANEATAAGLAGQQSPVTPAEQRHEPFTLEQLRYQWLRFANELPPKQGAESGRLKIMLPELKENCLVEAMVENSAAANYLRQVLPALTQYLRQGLRNDDIVVNFVVNTAVNVKPRAFSPREIYQEMLKKNEAFRQLAVTLRLEVL